MHKFKTIAIVALGAAALIVPTTAFAMEGQAASAVNVRSGPGTGFSIVDQLTAGEVVDITECAPSGWCYVEHVGPDGWVSATYLLPTEDEADVESEGAGSNPECSFGFNIGAGGPSLAINCGDAPLPPPPAPPADDEEEEEADGPQVCFYTNAGYDGASFCMGAGLKNSLNNTFRDKITSVEVGSGLKAKLCVDNNLGGYCKTVTVDTDDLPSQIDNKANSIKVFSGEDIVMPPVILTPINPGILGSLPDLLIPETYSTAAVNWKQTWEIDLDDGSQAAGNDNDLWYRAVTEDEKYMEPVNGAQIALGPYTQHGYAGCQGVSYTSDRIPLVAAPIGSYICVKTNEGRTSEFRVNGFMANGTMKIGYTTWAN
jgi:hypothetical protein